ncbi:MAG: methionyl-tRNA formyltransferase [Burkholderiaceae bacterium]|nr:methionyl-tRNA formyltransferase [Burkholderiaceae bacterium]
MNRPRGLRIVFAGTPEFAAAALAAIAAAGHEIVLVLTRVDKPAGRGRALHESPVKRLARERGFAIEQPRSLRDAALQAKLRALDADAMVVAAYGLILPAEVLAIPRHGCLNIHASLLPRWRGAAPIQRAIEAGDAQSGITIMQMDEGLDTGPMLLAAPEPILAGDTGGSLHDRLAALGARAIVAALARLGEGTLRPQPQPAEGVTYAHKLTRADALIDWTQPARRIVDRVRAFDPVPGAVALLERMPEAPIKVWSAQAAPADAAGEVAPAAAHDAPAAHAAHAAAPRPGTVLLAAPGRLLVACGDGAVELRELQRPGGRRLPAADFLRGCAVEPGERFVMPAAT